MNVLFVYTNINGFHDNCYAPGLAYVVSSTRAAGHEVRVVIVRTKEEYSQFASEIQSFSPRVVGFSAVSSQFGAVLEIADCIKNLFPNTVCVCGGYHPTVNPECILQAKSLDGIFIGESEFAFVKFLDRLDKMEPYHDVNNFAYVSPDGYLVKNKLAPLIQNLDILPFPDKDIYPYRQAIQDAGYAPFFFSRGCPYLCTYCCNHSIAKAYDVEQLRTRYRSPEASILEIEDALRRFSMTRIVIRDDIFGLNKKWREEFCSLYKTRIGMPFSVFSRVNVINESYLASLQDAGCTGISMAIESGNDYIRKEVMGRPISKEQIVNAFGMALRYGIETTAINLIGVPGETEEMILETLNLNRIVMPTKSRANVFYPYKGTILGDYCFANNLVSEEDCENFSNERRESVLRFTPEHKARLMYYHANWEDLVRKSNISSDNQ